MPPARHVSTANMATSPIAQPVGVINPPTTTVVVTAAAKSSSPRLSPVHGQPTHSALGGGGGGSTVRVLGPTSTCGTSPDHSVCPSIFSSTTTSASAVMATTTSHPASPEMVRRSTSPLSGAAVVVVSGTLSSSTSLSVVGADGDANTQHQQHQQQQQAPPPPPPLTTVVTVVPELATLGVSRHRRRSRPSVSPERVVIGSASPSTSSRHTRLRRQSTTLDEGWLVSSTSSFFIIFLLPWETKRKRAQTVKS